MAVVATNSFTPATGNGATTTFPFTFACRDPNDVEVYVAGVLQTSGYSVIINSDFNGGSVIFTTPPASGAAIVVSSNPSLTQPISFENAGPYNPEAVDAVADTAAIRTIATSGRLDRSLVAPPGEVIAPLPPASSRANQNLGFDNNGNPVVIPSTGNKGDPGGNVMAIGLFTVAAALSIAAGTNLVKTSGYSVDGKGGAEYVYDAAVDAAYVTANPHTSFVEAGGRGFKLSTDQRLNWKMFGLAVDDDTNTPTNDYAAWTAMLAWQQANLETGGAIFQYGVGAGPLIYCFGASYHGGNTTTIDYACQLLGFTQGVPGASPTQIRWDDNVNGIIIGADQNQHTSGYRFEGFTLKGGWTDLESESYALQWHAKGIRRNLQCYAWGGDGLKGDNSNATTGNSNGDVTDRIFVQNCRFAHTINGTDTNGGQYSGIVAVGNRQGGLHVSNDLGSQYHYFELEANARSAWNSGADANHPASYSWKNGHNYVCIVTQETWCQTNAPSGDTTSNQGWAYWQDAATASPATGIPAYAANMFWRAGGGIIHTGLSSICSFSGYIEQDECCQLDQFGRVDYIVGAPLNNFFAVHNGALQFFSGAGSKLQRPNGVSQLNGGYTYVRNHLRVGGNFVHEYCNQFIIDAVLGGGTDPLFQIKNNNSFSKISFLKSDGTEDGFISCSSSQFMWISHKTSVHLQVAGVDIATVVTAGLNLVTGKVLQVNGTQVVGARQTGWTASTGTPSRGAFAAAAAGTASATYLQSDTQGALNRIAALEARLIALEADMRTHGLIGT